MTLSLTDTFTLSLAFQQAKSWLPHVPGLLTQPGDNLQIYGYDDLGVDDFNYQFNTW